MMPKHATKDAPMQGLAYLIRERPASFLLSLVSGFVDTAGFVALFGLFTAHVTGNLVLAGAAIVQAKEVGVLSRLLMIPVFMASVAVASLLAHRARRYGWPVLTLLLVCEAIALGGFMVIGVALEPLLNSDAKEQAISLIGATGVLAMGIQNTLMREAVSAFLPTTMMTGNVTQFMIDLVQLVNARRYWIMSPTAVAELVKVRARFARTVPVLTGFVLGAACGAFGVAQLHFWCISIPLGIICILAIAALQDHRASVESVGRR